MNYDKHFEFARRIQLESNSNLMINNLALATISINGEFYAVTDLYYYKTKTEMWHEFALTNILTAEELFLEVCEDDSIELSISSVKDRRNLSKLGITPDEIEAISENESGSIVVDGKTFYYEDDYKCKFSRDSSGIDNTEKVYIYEFEADDGTCFTVEEWKSGDKYSYEAMLSYPLKETQVKAISL